MKAEAPFKIVLCDWGDCTRKIPEGDRHCGEHAPAYAQLAVNLEKGRKTNAYRAKFKKLKTLDGLSDMVAEMLWKLTNMEPEGEDVEVEGIKLVFDKGFLTALTSMIALQRTLVKDLTLERRIRAIDIMMQEKLGLSVKDILAREDAARTLSYAQTSKVIGMPSEEEDDDGEAD